MRAYSNTNGSFAHTVQPGIDTSREAERKRLEEAAEVVAGKAREISSAFSKRIPASVKVVTHDSGNVVVEAGGPEAPNAYPFDPPDNPPVRHPVYGHGPRDTWHWAPQPYRPFMEQAAEQAADRAAEVFADLVDDWMNEIGSDH